MDMSTLELAKANMKMMGFTEEEEELVLSDEFFIDGVAKDPEHFSKELIAYTIASGAE